MKRPAAVPDLHRATVEILRLAGRELRVFDHHREVCRVLATSCRCELVELWEMQGSHLLRSTLRSEAGDGRFHGEVDPAPRRGLPDGYCGRLLEARRTTRTGKAAALGGSGYALATGSTAGPCRVDRLHGKGGEGCPSLIMIPFAIEGSTDRGLLVLGHAHGSPLRPTAEEISEELADNLGIALAGRRAQAGLRERVKELTCLYSVSRLLGEAEAPIEQILSGVAELLPAAWQYPELASACVILDGRSFLSPRHQDGPHRQRADILVRRERRGFLEVCYRDSPALKDSAFLAEEQHLLQTLARQLGIFLEQRQADEERANLQDQLRHADRLATIGSLSAGVAHELNEPLGAILGFAQLAQKCPALPVSAEEDLTKIVAASLQARSIVKKLMLFARQSPPRKGPVSLNQLVEDGVLFLAGRFERDGVTLSKSLAPDLPPIVADGSQLQQVLVNLVVNAVQAMPGGGRLGISTTSAAGEVALVVEDTGVGMTPEVLRRAFLPFFTTKEVGKGTGLGLAVVHGIVKAHGGRIQVDSQPGRGTTFRVLLPAGKTESNHDG